MAHTVTSQFQTPADALRTNLDALERLAVKPNAASVEELLVTLDATEAQFDLLEASAIDVRSERVRWENLLRRLDSQPQLIATAAAAVPGGMNALRAAHGRSNMQDLSFWWLADRERAERQRKSLTRVLTTLVVIVVLVVGGFSLFNFFFPPDPDAVAYVQASGAIERSIDEGDWDAALATAEETVAANDDPQLLILAAAVAEKVAGLPENTRADVAARAAELNEQARTAIGDDLIYWIALGNSRLRVFNADAAQEAADQAFALAPENAEVALLLGRVALERGDRQTALFELDRAYNLSLETQPQVAVSARVMYAELARQIELPSMETATP